MEITAKVLCDKFLEFFREREHKIIQSASLIPENDPSVLFTTAGMHPLTPYLMGEKHPSGNRLADVQKCIRTGDIDEVGDAGHLTFFEMLGNWSLGDYFKEQSIKWSWEFLTSDKYLGLAPEKLCVTVFEGDEHAPRDEESANIWKACGMPSERIYYLPKKHNWWGPAGGLTGPCGPDTEIFYYKGDNPENDPRGPADPDNLWLEIWNNVFMQYNKTASGAYEPLSQKNVDTGMGLERTVCVLNGFESVYEIDVFRPVIKRIEQLCGKEYGRENDNTVAMRVVADHVRSAVFLLGDPMGVTPSNVDQGYVLRRIIRRAVRYANKLGMKKGDIVELAQLYIQQYAQRYPELGQNADKIKAELSMEEERFLKTLVQGEKEFRRVASSMQQGGVINGETAFKLYDTFGFPPELTVEYAKELGLTVDLDSFTARYAEHQAKSQAGSAQRFKGGLMDGSEATARLHTATHLLQAALRAVLGKEVKQKGSNITPERLRFDFSFGRPMTAEEIEKTQELVNEAIQRNLPVCCDEMTVAQAEEKGAIGLFGDKYGEIVKVYTIGDVSTEICGGPHAENTGDLGSFRIVKEQSSSGGVRRIKAVLE